MDYDDIIDFSLLIKNVNELAPSGVDPRTDISPSSQYYRLKDIRSNARANERKLLVEEDDFQSLVGDWRPIIDEIPNALVHEVKDLEFAAWLIEALCRVYGFRGLAIGFKTAHLIIENFWDSLYPSPDDDDIEFRIASLIGLNGYDGDGALITPIMSIPITQDTSSGCYATWQYIRALDLSRENEDKQRKKTDNGVISVEQINRAVSESSKEFYGELVEQLNSAIDEFEQLSKNMDRVMGQPQPTTAISKSLQKCLDSVKYLAADKLAVISSEVNDSIDINIDGETQTIGAVDNQLQTRQQVIRSLQQAAEFFRKTEPHSPMSYSLEQVIRWSSLTLPELLQELIDDSNSRNGYFKLTGITETK
ncbi:type VI secretion system protein TssA [Shewanella baltica]|uniref:type VI secretion system protein TssA n=1 Tax=Shewanella TaxID=22 RepID=UPI0001E10D03|nr:MULTISPECIES: type VI secretion system protein TssA [Shewanella]RBP78741.1 type VI secretion system protein ImpA [Shewanella putrefaciens]AEG11317.1 type VI secretion-associated protein, ImpA family [Shewanella baltica BA175]EHQ15152.1 type VI secretion-associated protein, ImpA family [Shewanella baltica OS183]MCS6123662.1 type VI secretion system protein TssA [Shewanella baltica]MCS6180335.1 type VI secretion system protein TssA [Shewanella baltica]